MTLGISYDWEQLDSNDQKLINEASKKHLQKLVEKDIKGFWELCHSEFKKTTPLSAFTEIGNILSNIINSIDSVEFIDGKKVIYTVAPKTNQLVTGGSLDKSDPKYLEYYTIAEIKNQALTIYKLKSYLLSKNITMKFGLEGSIYKLTSIEVNTSAINNKDAEYYFDLAKKWEFNQSMYPRFIALNMAYRLSYLGNGTNTYRMIQLIDEIKTLKSDSILLSEIQKWNINDTIFEIINIDFLETQTDVTLNITYVSKAGLGEKPTTIEARKLLEFHKSKYPEFVKEFERFLFTAYEASPVNRTKQYRYYRVAIDINKLD